MLYLLVSLCIAMSAGLGMDSDSPNEGARHEDPYSHHSRDRNEYETHKPEKGTRSKSDSRMKKQPTELDGQPSVDHCARLEVDPAAVDMFKMTFKV